MCLLGDIIIWEWHSYVEWGICRSLFPVLNLDWRVWEIRQWHRFSHFCFSLISQIPPDAPQQTFMNVAREIFSDGVFNWGRVVALFYFAFKMAMKVSSPTLSRTRGLTAQGLRECLSQVWKMGAQNWQLYFNYGLSYISRENSIYSNFNHKYVLIH